MRTSLSLHRWKHRLRVVRDFVLLLRVRISISVGIQLSLDAILVLVLILASTRDSCDRCSGGRRSRRRALPRPMESLLITAIVDRSRELQVSRLLRCCRRPRVRSVYRRGRRRTRVIPRSRTSCVSRSVPLPLVIVPALPFTLAVSRFAWPRAMSMIVRRAPMRMEMERSPRRRAFALQDLRRCAVRNRMARRRLRRRRMMVMPMMMISLPIPPFAFTDMTRVMRMRTRRMRWRERTMAMVIHQQRVRPLHLAPIIRRAWDPIG